MNRKITENDLILYFYNELDNSVSDYISENLPTNPEWSETLKFLQSVNLSLKQNTPKGPNKTTLSIIFEESQHQENHTF